MTSRSSSGRRTATAHGDGVVADGADTLVIRDGHVVAQTIHYSVKSR